MSDSPAHVVPLWRRLLLGVLILVLLCFVVGMLVPQGYENRDYLRELASLDADDPNWRWDDLQTARAVIPDSENSALLIAEVYRRLPITGLDHTLFERLQAVPRAHFPTPELLADLESTLDALEPAVLAARPLIDRPKGRFPLDIGENPLTAVLSDQQNCRKVAALLSLDSFRLACRKEYTQALVSVLAQLNAAQAIGDEPVTLSQLMRCSIVERTLADIERILALGEVADANLLALEKALRLELEHNPILTALRGERATQFLLFELLADGKKKPRDLFGPDDEPDFREQIFGLSKREIRRQQVGCLQLMNRHIEAAKKPTHEMVPEIRRLDGELKTFVVNVRLARAVFLAVKHFGDACARRDALAQCMRVLIAAERFRVKKNRWPTDMSELVPEYLPVVPLDPFDGKPIRFVAWKDGVKAYSIGQDGIDNHGTIDNSKSSTTGFDVGYVLVDKAKRGVVEEILPRPKEQP
jgi:hypothetical protein